MRSTYVLKELGLRRKLGVYQDPPVASIAFACVILRHGWEDNATAFEGDGVHAVLIEVIPANLCACIHLRGLRWLPVLQSVELG